MQCTVYHLLTLKKLNPHSPALGKIKKFFFEKITPLYGDQANAIRKIIEAKDRVCVALMHNADPLGLVVYKKELTNEYREYGLHRYFEIKTLALINPETTSGNRYGSLLLLSAAKAAVKMDANGLFVTVSSGKPEAYHFFEKMGFTPIDVIKDLYKPGLDEIYFAHNDPSELLISLSTKAAHSLELLGTHKNKKTFAHATS